MLRQPLVFLFLAVNLWGALCSPVLAADKSAAMPKGSTEGPIETAKIVVGPFDLHRRYRSMEGPYVSQSFQVSDLLDTKQIVLPESAVTFVEGNSGAAPSMSAPQTQSEAPTGLVHNQSGKRELYWFKGIKLQVLDENDKPLPTAEFICHLNLDVDQDFRRKAFPRMGRGDNSRLVTLTQGQTEFSFPDGFAVPVASDEKWSFTFQAANRTTDQHRRIKQLCTVSFIKDSQLVYPIKALNWYAPYVTVAVDHNSPDEVVKEHKQTPHCLASVFGVTAPNSSAGAVLTDSLGRRLSGHWVVPPGHHVYGSPILEERDAGFASKDRCIHAVWSHVHPLCTKVSLGQCKGAKSIFTVGVKTKTEGGLEIEHIDTISSSEGIIMPAKRQYQIEATYDNSTGQPQDSMVVCGVFFTDDEFVRPDWFLTSNEAYCGAPTGQGTTGGGATCKAAAEPEPEHYFNGRMIGGKTGDSGNTNSYVSKYPLFDSSKDGPTLNQNKTVELETSAGKIRLVLEPSLAPQHATQIYRLLTHGVFNGTPINRYEPNFVLQVSNAETKADGQSPLSAENSALLRRLPLEVRAQTDGAVRHQKYVLTMAHYDGDVDSAVSSFSILLGDAPHLDGNYTVFGHLVPDAQTLHTMDKITQQFGKSHPVITSAQAI